MCFYQGFEISELYCIIRSRFYLQKCFLIQHIIAFTTGKFSIILIYKYRNMRSYIKFYISGYLKKRLKSPLAKDSLRHGLKTKDCISYRVFFFCSKIKINLCFGLNGSVLPNTILNISMFDLYSVTALKINI